MAGISKLCISILIERWGVFLFISKNRTPVSEKLVGNAISSEDLMENLIVATQCFLSVKLCADNSAAGIIDGKVEVPDDTGDPFIWSCIHLDQFTEVRSSGASGMGVFDSYKVLAGLRPLLPCTDWEIYLNSN